MFFVINKEKVYAYIVSILTIVTLFFMSHVLNSELSTVEETSSNIEQNENNTQDLVENDSNLLENNWIYMNKRKI